VAQGDSVSRGFGTGLGFALGLLAVVIGLPILGCAGIFCLGIFSSPSSYPPAPASGSISSPSSSVDRQTLKIVGVDSRVTESNDVWWKYAWILRVQNQSNRVQSFDVKIQFLDADQFVIETEYEFGLAVDANSVGTFRGTALITTSSARNVAAVNAIIDQ
jgi:hypothetical protein